MNPQAHQGLSTAEVDKRLLKYGKNIFLGGEQQSGFKTFLQEFKSPLVLMLLFATVISFITGSYVSASLIILIIIISSIIDFTVSYKSQKAAESLAKQITPTAIVLRDGKEQLCSIEYLVPGDIVLLEAGNIIPADGIVIEEKDFFTNEASLTGESLPVEKKVPEEVFLGSGVVTGHAKMEVKKTGKETRFSEIVSLLEEKETPSEFERGIKQFTLLITKIVIIMSLFVFVVNSFMHHSVLESLIFSLALAVGITPELLPMIIALNVSEASIRMSKKGVIVKKLSAIENFGGMNILCTDKTGTLTEDRIAVVRYIDQNGADSEELLKLAYIDSILHTGTKSPLDQAIVSFKDFPINDCMKVDELPFDFERRRDSIVFDLDAKRTLVSKGAPEAIWSISLLNNEDRIKAKQMFDELSSEGYRVLALATKDVSLTQFAFSSKDELDMQFRGYIAFIDPPKEGVKSVLMELEQRNIEIKVITGDHRLVTEKVAREVGLVSKGTIESNEIEKLSDEELSKVVESNTLFVRVTPEQKNRIIGALQKNNHTVGYIGDGINDAPALRTADVGISVNNAVDVAKEAADIILLTKGLEQLIEGVVEGRRTFANTIKYITMAVSSNFGNMFSMTGASLILPFLPMLPVQLLLTNLLYESSQFSLSFDRVDQDVLNRPNPWDITYIKRFMIFFGTLSSIFDIATFFILYKVFSLSESAFQTGWFIESFATQALVIFFIRSHVSIFKASKPHIAVVLSAFGAVMIAWYIALSIVGKLFGFTAIPIVVIVILIAIVLIYFVIVELLKRVFYKKFKLANTV